MSKIITMIVSVGAAAILAVLVTVIRDSGRIVKANYKIESDKLKKRYKIVMLSDLHNKSFGRDNERLLAQIEEEQPDAVIVAGDMMTSEGKKTTLEVPISLMKRLCAKYPVYYGNGNHEYRMKVYRKEYGDKYDTYLEALQSCGVCLLLNEKVYLPDANIEISGLEIERHYYRRFFLRCMEESYVESLLGERRKDCFEILIAHNPDFFPNYAAWGADLTLSGHVHGGVMKLPFLGGVVSPMMRLFPKYDGGLFEEDGKKMVLGRGLGMHTIPVRIFNPGELVVITLEPK